MIFHAKQLPVQTLAFACYLANCRGILFNKLGRGGGRNQPDVSTLSSSFVFSFVDLSVLHWAVFFLFFFYSCPATSQMERDAATINLAGIRGINESWCREVRATFPAMLDWPLGIQTAVCNKQGWKRNEWMERDITSSLLSSAFFNALLSPTDVALLRDLLDLWRLRYN